MKKIEVDDPATRQRLWDKTMRDGSGCWLWMGAKNNHGYGILTVRGKQFLTHRLSFTFAKEPIPEGMTLDHLCRTPACLNPEHLEPVTHAENLRRGVGAAKAAELAQKRMHCRRGHKLGAYIPGKARPCAECDKLSRQRRWAKKVASRGPLPPRDMTKAIAARQKQMAEQTHCKSGHPLSGENLRITARQRVCRECGRQKARRFYARQRAKRC